MEKLLIKLNKDIKRKEIEKQWLAAKMGVSPQSLQAYLKGTSKMTFIQFFHLISNIYENKEELREMIKIYLEDAKKMDYIKECLEWSLQNAEYELFELAISKVNSETRKIYNLLMLRNQKKIDENELLEQVETIKLENLKQKDMEVLVQIVYLYALNDTKNYNLNTIYSKFIIERVEGMKKGFLKDTYKMKVKELAAVANLKNNNPEMARSIAEQLIQEVNEDLLPLVLNSVYNLLSEVYVFTDYHKSIEYNKKAIRLFESLEFGKYQYREYSLKATHDFIKITNNRYEDLYFNDQSEVAHFLAKQPSSEMKEEALEILMKMEKQKPLSPHQLYYRYLATGKELDRKIALKEFYKKGDLYYSRLAENP
ncbi:AimR family lysis-lysogeny pheromone receptor [Bacillus sp. ISL-57]|uniref:AimR family lysis-lysogeny pheromone receptor n=1 Tax=Bacillus sp. ISL-57 TaxID=2819135 RepID=UPI001BE60FB8|nr:AimR family lysis-lysogeny pheromone receptor [Bacillus sp. ISL-57]MBT2718305.1 AimR family lysis-lysogeny pheromone receptor [Bacillus sp. ISL-57]